MSITEYIAGGAATLSAVTLYLVHWQNRNLTKLIHEKDAQYSKDIALLNHHLSKEAHASSYLYTRKADILEEGYKIIGQIHFWAEKCVVPLTSKDFGGPKEKAEKMISKFEDFRLFTLKNAPFIDQKSSLWMKQSDLMEAVNFIHNKLSIECENEIDEKWHESVNMLKEKLQPAANEIREEIQKLMNNDR